MHFAVADYALDILQNAFESGAENVRLLVEEGAERIDVVVEDDGVGMDPAGMARALDPFKSGGAKHPGRKVGLGLPFLEQAATQAEGRFSLESRPGLGTKVAFGFPLAQVDCPPIGDLPGLFFSALCFPGRHELAIERGLTGPSGTRRAYRVSRGELRSALGDFERVSSLSLLKAYLASQEEDLLADVDGR